MRYPRPTRESFIPKHAIKIVSKRSSAVAYLYELAETPYAMGFVGQQSKPALHYRFRSAERRAASVAEWMLRIDAWEADKVARRASKKSFQHTLKVGDLLSNSWGYDQTNVEFFQVTLLVGKTMVEVRPIAQRVQQTGFLSGTCLPAQDEFTGPVRRHRVLEGNTLDIHHAGFGRASLYERVEVAPGVKVGPAQRWSSYA